MALRPGRHGFVGHRRACPEARGAQAEARAKVRAVSPSGALLPPTCTDLEAPAVRPRFQRWTGTAVGELQTLLGSPDLETRAYRRGALLREANNREVGASCRLASSANSGCGALASPVARARGGRPCLAWRRPSGLRRRHRVLGSPGSITERISGRHDTAWANGAIPVVMEAVHVEARTAHNFAGHLPACLVAPGVALRASARPCAPCHAGEPTGHGSLVSERSPWPILGDLQEERCSPSPGSASSRLPRQTLLLRIPVASVAAAVPPPRWNAPHVAAHKALRGLLPRGGVPHASPGCLP